MTYSLLQADPVIQYLEQTVGKVYTEQIRKQTAPPELFNINAIQNKLLDCRSDLLKRRNECINDLKEKTHAINAHIMFVQDLQQINKNLDGALDKSKSLSKDASKLSVDFAQITDRLASATSIVTKAQNISTILAYIKILNSSNDLKKVREMMIKLEFPIDNIVIASEQIAKLIKIIAITEAQSANNVRTAKENLIQFRNEFRKRAISKLTENLQTENINGMREAFIASSSLSDSEGAIAAYIYKLPYYCSEEGLMLYCGLEFDKMSDSKIKDQYSKLCDYLTNVCTSIWPTVEAVFDKTQQAKLCILSNIFDKILLGFVQSVLEEKENKDVINYCSMLEALYSRTVEFLQEIWKLDHQQFTSSTILNTLFQSAQKEKYAKKELQVLNAQLVSLVANPLDKLKTVIAQTSAISNVFKKNEEKIDPFELFDPSVPSSILSIASAAWCRCAVVALPEDEPKILNEILQTSIFSSLQNYIIQFMSVCSTYLKSLENAENIPRFLHLIKMVNGTVVNLEDKYSTSLKNILMSHPIIHADFTNSKNKLMNDLEFNARIGLQNSVDLIMKQIEKILVKQKKADFNGNDIDIDQTQTSREVCAFLNRVITSIDEHIDGENKVNFYTFIGNRLFSTLKDHILRFKYSQTGGTCLFTDMQYYMEVFNKLNSPSLDHNMLNLISVLKMIQQPHSLLKEVWEMESYSPEFTKIAKELVERRTDANEININEIFPLT